MTYLRQITMWLSRWIDDAAYAIFFLGGLFRSSRRVRLVEQLDGAFVIQAVHGGALARRIGEPFRIDDGRIVGSLKATTLKRLAGSAIEIVLLPKRFMFRPFELPRRASDFLEGIVRAQVDRLTPWSPEEAAFGWTTPMEIAGGRLTITVAATARALIAPILQTLSSLRPNSITVSTMMDGAGDSATPIRIFEQRTGGEFRVRQIRRVLIAVAALTGLAASAAVAAWIIVGADFDSQRADIERRLVERRASLLSGRGPVAADALARLERRKWESPSVVIVLEALSEILPDQTYLTELQVEAGKLQIAGMTRDAPVLIRLIEQSQHFTRATFFAPTTRAPNESAEHFHIEAQIEPSFQASP